MLRRLLFSFPTLLAMALVTFALSKCAPGDPVWPNGPDASQSNVGVQAREDNYRRDAAALGLDKPAFYCSISTAAYPDEFQQILFPERRERLRALIAQTGNWAAVKQYEATLEQFASILEHKIPDSVAEKTILREAFGDLRQKTILPELEATFQRVQATLHEIPIWEAKIPLDTLAASIQMLRKQATPQLLWVPTFYWHGFDNQFQHWFFGFFQGKLGRSHYGSQEVWEILRPCLGITMLINGMAILLAYCLSIPLGVLMSRYVGSRFDRWMRAILMWLYAMPIFWFAGLLVMGFATKGQGWPIFPGIGVGGVEDAELSSLDWLVKNTTRLVLPILVLSLHIVTVLCLQMRGAMIQTLGQDYIRTARAKGLSERTVHWRHAFWNGLFPLITIFGSIFPAVLAGSVTIELIFNIPGMGQKTFDAFMGKDYPVMFAILMMAGILTIVGNLIADLLYAWVDPRVQA